ncbi:MAG: hypothetical protein ACI81V_001091, partial [Lentimonas sp.]
DQGASTFEVSAASFSSGGRLDLRLDSATGELLGSVDISSTAGWSAFQTFTTNELASVTGVRDLYFVFVDSNLSNFYLFDIESFIFSNSDLPPTDVGVLFSAVPYAAESNPESDNLVLDMGNKIGYIKNGTWVSYENFNFDQGASTFEVSAASFSSGGRLDLRLDSATGELLGSVDISSTAGWSAFQTFTTNELASVTGVRDLYFVFVDSNLSNFYLFDIESFSFSNSDLPPTDVGVLFSAVPYAAESNPESDNLVLDMGNKIGYIKNGTWVAYPDFLFGSSASSITVNASSDGRSGTIELRLGSPTGELIGSVAISNTTGWSTFEAFTADLAVDPVGQAATLYLVFVNPSHTDYLFDVKSFSFNP